MNAILRWGIIGVVAVGGGYIIYRQLKKSKTPISGSDNGQPSANGNQNASCNFPLKKGSINPCVKQLQQEMMNTFGISILPKYGADGNWGSETEGAVKAIFHSNQINTMADLQGAIAYLQTLKAIIPFPL